MQWRGMDRLERQEKRAKRKGQKDKEMRREVTMKMVTVLMMNQLVNSSIFPHLQNT